MLNGTRNVALRKGDVNYLKVWDRIWRSKRTPKREFCRIRKYAGNGLPEVRVGISIVD